MKKILLFLGACLTQYTIQAQNIDLAAYLTIADGTAICPTKHLTPQDPPVGDSIHGIWGIINNGPDALLTEDQITYRTSFHAYLTETEAIEEGVPFEDRYAWYSIATLSENKVAGDPAIGYFSYDDLSEIGMLCDWELWDTQDTLVRYGPPHEQFIDGQEYGFFVMTWGMGSDANTIQNNDENMANNIAVTRIIWDSDCSSGLQDLIAPKDKIDLNVYPNPAVNELHFNHKLAKNTHISIRVTDMTGRSVLTKNMGFKNAGEHKFTVNISTLAPGNYQMEMNTGTGVGLSKFTVTD